MEFRIANTFTANLARLTGDEQKAAANTPRLEPVSTLRQRIAERARHALGMAWVIFIASWTNGYATARSEAICRGAGCGRTRTSGSVGGQGQQRPWSTRPPTARI